jgi:hypothetical protein
MEFKKITVKDIYGEGENDYSIFELENQFDFIALICEFHKSDSVWIAEIKGAKTEYIISPLLVDYIVVFIGMLLDGVFSENEVYIELKQFENKEKAEIYLERFYLNK